MSIFDAPQGTPGALIAGDDWRWRRDDLAALYPPGDHALTYRFLPFETAGTAFDVLATEDADGYLIEVPAATTAGLTPGRWQWTAFLERTADGMRATVNQGRLTVRADPATATEALKSDNRRILEALVATIEGRAGTDVLEYEIEGRSLKRTPLMDLHRLRARYAALVAAEEGTAPGGIAYRRVRFTCP